MIKIHKNTDGFTIVEGLLIVLVVAVIGFGGYYVWHTQHKTKITTVTTATSSKPTTTKANTSTATTTSNPYAGWSTVAISQVGLTLQYPSDWVVHTQYTDSDAFWLYQSSYNNGNPFLALMFTPISSQEQLPGGISGPSNSSTSSVASFTFNNQPAYIVDNSQDNTYYLSSCAAPSLCFFQDKNNSSDSLELSLTYSTLGQDPEQMTFPNNPTELSEAVKIMESLSY